MGGRPTRTWGAASQPYSCDHGSHGRLWCACFSSKGALCVRCMAEIGPCRELPPSPDAPGGGPRCTPRSILPPCPNKRPGAGRCGGEREGNIERVRQWRCLDFEIMMLDLDRWFVSWRCALRYPLAPWLCSPRGSLGTESRRRLQVLHGLGPFLRLRYLRSLISEW